jgi:hypothetical protein
MQVIIALLKRFFHACHRNLEVTCRCNKCRLHSSTDAVRCSTAPWCHVDGHLDAQLAPAVICAVAHLASAAYTSTTSVLISEIGMGLMSRDVEYLVIFQAINIYHLSGTSWTTGKPGLNRSAERNLKM